MRGGRADDHRRPAALPNVQQCLVVARFHQERPAAAALCGRRRCFFAAVQWLLCSCGVPVVVRPANVSKRFPICQRSFLKVHALTRLTDALIPCETMSSAQQKLHIAMQHVPANLVNTVFLKNNSLHEVSLMNTLHSVCRQEHCSPGSWGCRKLVVRLRDEHDQPLQQRTQGRD